MRNSGEKLLFLKATSFLKGGLWLWMCVYCVMGAAWGSVRGGAQKLNCAELGVLWRGRGEGERGKARRGILQLRLW